MFFKEAMEYLNQVSVTGTVLGLDSIKALMKELGDPQEQLKIVHLAGTNGKGSILTYTVSVLKEAGYRVGSYSSPSVLGYFERFQINGQWMKEEELAPLVMKVKQAADHMVEMGLAHPTVFELETAIAFLYFYEQCCDYVVLEVGMGGDLDSTNIIKAPCVCAFASISMDHIGVLGNTLEEIATTKSGIIKPGTRVVVGWQKDVCENVLVSKAQSLGCEILKVQRERIEILESEAARKELFQEFHYKQHKNIKIHLLGRHQIENATTALEILEALRETGAEVSEEDFQRGFEQSRWPGRFEVILTGKIPEQKLFVLDGAHNEDAAKRLAEGLGYYFPEQQFEAVMGVFKDKEHDKIIEILKPFLKKVYTIDLPNSGRTLKKEVLARELLEYGIEAEVADDLKDGLRKTRGNTLITGSLSFLGEARGIILER